MLSRIISASLQNRLLVLAIAMFFLGYGGWQAVHLPIDVFPNLDQSRGSSSWSRRLGWRRKRLNR